MNAFLNDLNHYEQTLMKKICSDKDIVSLLTDNENPIVPDKNLMYTKVFPFAYIPDTVQEASSFITFTITVPRVYNSLVKEVIITIDIITHESLMRTKQGKRTTLIATAMDKLFNGSKDLGICKMDLVSVGIDIPNREYHTRRLIYSIDDWNRVNKYYEPVV